MAECEIERREQKGGYAWGRLKEGGVVTDRHVDVKTMVDDSDSLRSKYTR